jgi:hypothetical protein
LSTESLIYAVISVFAVTLILSSFTPFIVFAEPPDPRWSSSNSCTKVVSGGQTANKCCWREKVPGQILGKEYYQTCTGVGSGKYSCGPKVAQSIATPPNSGESVLPGGGLAEQPEQPLFGENLPPTGGVEQPPTSTTQPTPGGGANVPTEGGSAEQPPAPQDDQGGGLPTIKNQENVPPGGGVTEQPEDDGQEDSSEGAETAGPLT